LGQDTASLRALYVAPGFRRQGVGRQLFAAAVDLARMRGKISLAWLVKRENLEAIVFYLKQGGRLYESDGEDYYFGFALREVQVDFLEQRIRLKRAGMPPVSD